MKAGATKTGGNKRALIMLAIGFVVLMLALIIPKVLFKSSDSAGATATTTVVTSPGALGATQSNSTRNVATSSNADNSAAGADMTGSAAVVSKGSDVVSGSSATHGSTTLPPAPQSDRNPFIPLH